MTEKVNLKSLSRDGLVDFVENLGLPRYRADQLIHRIYRKHTADINSITEFPDSLRRRLNECAFISSLTPVKKLVSPDRTEKYLFALEDGITIESVLIQDRNRLTLCISSQAGCPLGCLFCRTGRLGLIRNLKSYEIFDQVIAVQQAIRTGRKINHIVLMGMGEPLLNFNEVIEAIWRIVLFIGISKRKITLSTAGIIPRIALLAEKAPEINLAVSLNASTGASRDKIMPVNKKYPLSELIMACKRFPLSPRRRITFEYVLIKGINDSVRDAGLLAGLLKGIRCKINLIPLNPSGSGALKRPADSKILEFQRVLLSNNMTALIRKSRGQVIQAACGQLAGEISSSGDRQFL